MLVSLQSVSFNDVIDYIIQTPWNWCCDWKSVLEANYLPLRVSGDMTVMRASGGMVKQFIFPPEGLRRNGETVHLPSGGTMKQFIFPPEGLRRNGETGQMGEIDRWIRSTVIIPAIDPFHLFHEIGETGQLLVWSRLIVFIYRFHPFDLFHHSSEGPPEGRWTVSSFLRREDELFHHSSGGPPEGRWTVSPFLRRPSWRSYHQRLWEADNWLPTHFSNHNISFKEFEWCNRLRHWN